MKKIAVLRCLRTSNNCTGSGCGDVQMPNNEEGLRKSWIALLLSALKPCI